MKIKAKLRWRPGWECEYQVDGGAVQTLKFARRDRVGIQPLDCILERIMGTIPESKWVALGAKDGWEWQIEIPEKETQ